MQKATLYILCLATFLGFYACETPFTPDNDEYVPEVVVEGYIEAGGATSVPLVLLTESQPFFSEIKFNELGNIFIHDAIIKVSNGQDTVQLEEVCISDIPDELRPVIKEAFEIDLDSIGIDFCIYTDLSFSMLGEVGKTYSLSVAVNHQNLSATTTIPKLVPLDSVWFTPIPDIENDTLKELATHMTDPGGETNFYRYFTSTDNGVLLPGLQSVLDDKLVDGQTFRFTLPKAQARTDEFDPATYGYFHVGDTVVLKWTCIDQAHFDFWNTVEYNASNQGPFSSYTRVSSNIKGGLGIWGGYVSQYFVEVVPK